METWLAYALASAIFTTAAVLTQKKTLIKEHAMEFSTVLAFFTLLVSLPFLLVIDYSKLQLIPLVILFFTSILGAIGFLLVAKSIRHMKITHSTPLLSLSPGITALLAFIFLGESLTFNRILGITLLLLGAYVLETKSAISLLASIKALGKSKYISYIFLALLLYGIAPIFDRIILYNYDMQPEAYIVFVHIFLAFHFIIMLTLFYDGIKGIKHGLKKAGWWIFLISVFTVGYRLSQAEAIKLVSVGLATSVRRISTLFTIFIGGELFHEDRLLRKFIASLIIILGTILIIL